MVAFYTVHKIELNMTVRNKLMIKLMNLDADHENADGE